MPSVRFDERLSKRLAKAAKDSGLSVSQIIREGTEERVAHLLGDTAAKRLADVIGKVRSGQRRSSKSHREEYTEAMDAKFRRDRRRVAG